MAEQANAAQLASRKIKSARGVKAKLGYANRIFGSSGGLGVNATSSITSQDRSSGGGLFGGGLNAPGTFDFSAPVQGISFGSNPGTPPPPWGSDNEEDRRADTTAEEAERRNKPFRMVDGSAAAGPQPFSNTFQRTPLSALGQQPNGLSSASDTAKSNHFQLSRSQSPATAPTYAFGSTSSQEQQPASNAFSFGQNSQTVQGTTPFRFDPPPATQDKPVSNIFSFNQLSSQSQPVSTAINFGSTTATEKPAAQDKPVSNMFSFNQPPSQSQPVSTAINFGSTTATEEPAAQDKPVSNMFSFNQPPAQSQPVSTAINFGSTTATEKPAGTIFAFGQTSTQQKPSGSSANFNSAPAPTNIFGNSMTSNSNATTNIFGQSNQKSTNSGNIFSGIDSQTAATNGVFGNQSQQPLTPAKSLFADSAQKLAPTSSSFGGSSQQSALTSNLFGNSHQVSNPPPVFFGASKEQPTSSSNLFGFQKEKPEPTSNSFDGQKERGEQNSKATSTTSIFGGQQQQPAPASNIFAAAKPSSNLFGSQQPGTTSNIFGNKAPLASTGSIFGNQAQQSNSNSSTNFFANINKSTPQTINESEKLVTNGASQDLNGKSTSSKPAALVGTLGSGLQNGDKSNGSPPSPKPAPATLQSISSPLGSTNEPESETVLPSIEVEGPLVDNEHLVSLENTTPAQPSAINFFSSMKPIDAPEDASQPAPIGMFPSLSQLTSVPSTNTNIFAKANAIKNSSSPTTSSIASSLSPSTLLSTSASTAKNNELAKLQDYYSEMGEVQDSIIEEKCPPHFTDAQKVQFFAAYRIRSLNKGIKMYIDGAQSGADFSPAFHHYIARRDEILEACATGLNNLKRRHGEVEDRHRSPNKRIKPSDSIVADQHTPRTSSLLKTQPVMNTNHSGGACSPDKLLAMSSGKPSRRSRSPEKLFRPEEGQPFKSLMKTHTSFNGSTTPKAPPPSKPLFFSQQPAMPPSPSPKGKRKAEVQIDKDHPTEEEAIGVSHSGKLEAINGNNAGSATSSVFKSILEKPSQPSLGSPEKKMFSLIKTHPTDKPRFNPFANLPMPSGSAFSTSPVTKSSTFSSAPSDPFFPKPTTNSPSIVTPEPTSSSTAPSSLAPKPTPTTTALASSSDGEGKVVKPPTFGNAPVNFLAQFGQESKKSMAEAEAEAMAKAKMEDMDSDDDEAEWEAKYKERRAAEKKATEELTKSKRATFVPGKGFTFDLAQDVPGADKSAPKFVFNQTNAPSSLSTNLLAPINRSEASSPGAASSRASSIFDGLAPPKPVSFGSHNIFGHLSDVDSGADSGKGNDADDDSTDEETGGSGEELDGENNDTTGDLRKGHAADPGTAGNSVEETGRSISSTKKPTNIFNFGESSNSGASVPSTNAGSLFDRISKDSNGNPIRQLPVENRDTAGAGAASPFGGDGGNSFAKYSKTPTVDQTKSPQDKTWKQDSPIKFGASTSPTVNVTAPTPTKPNQFTGLFGSITPKLSSPTPTGSPLSGVFGNNNASSPPTPTSGVTVTGLFGNNNTIKPTFGLFANLSNAENKPPAVGFNFGAVSTTTSSLFPSTAGSTTTSRATSPGGTTDAESNAENIDPDVEHHEQIDLTSSGPGEENEEVLHEVRAKALKFEPSKDESGKSGWAIKGLGPLRVLKNKETGSCRILLRADPRGTIVLNKGILGNVTYTATEKTLKLLTAGEGGQGLETWLLQVKTPAGAEELAGVLEANK